uniref:IS200/IS605 family transposase n=1 Tax=Eiseniibacteriota bacterium TaxID=2212470 RepID=A0A832MNG2_UNCEI
MEHALAPEINQALRGRWEPVYRSQLHYLVTWSTRGRRPVLRDRHTHALSALVAEVCDERGFALLEAAAGPDHVHLLIALRPSHSVASAIREIKGRTAVALIERFPELRVWLRGNLVWDERYAVETVSPLRLERVRQRLRALHAADDDLAQAS